MIIKQTLPVSGMSCAVCAGRVEKTVADLDGVKNSSVNFASESLTVEYDSTVTSLDLIKDAVEKIGYKVVEEDNSRTVTIPISGMSCQACAQRVEKGLNELEGVDSVSVNLLTEKASVAFNPEKTRLSIIKHKIDELGYKALEIEQEEIVDANRARLEKESRSLRRRFIISAIFALPLLYIAMGPMIYLPVPGFLSPDNYPLRFALTQLLLTIPIVITGRRFYSVGFRALLQRSPNMDSLIALGTSAAVVYSLYSTILIYLGDGHAVHGLYFESAGVIISLILLGKTLEAISKGKMRKG